MKKIHRKEPWFCDAVEKIMKKALSFILGILAGMIVFMLILAFNCCARPADDADNEYTLIDVEILKIDSALYGSNVSDGAGGMVGIFRKGDTIYAERIRAAEIVIKSDGPTEIVVNRVANERKIFITEAELYRLLEIPD